MRIIVALASPFQTRLRKDFGTEIYNEHGSISVVTDGPHSPTKHSVVEFVVNENARGKGYGHELVKELIRRYKQDIGAQVSSVASLHVFYKQGFRPFSDPDATLPETLKLFKEEWGSLNLRYKPNQRK